MISIFSPSVFPIRNLLKLNVLSYLYLNFHILNISLCASFCIISSHLHITLIFFRCLICFKSIFFYYYYFLIFKSFSVFYKISVLLSRALGVLILCYFCWSFLKVILSPCAFYNFGLRVNVCLSFILGILLVTRLKIRAFWEAFCLLLLVPRPHTGLGLFLHYVYCWGNICTSL